MRHDNLEDRRTASQETWMTNHPISGRHPIRVLLAESREVVRAGLRAFLHGEESLEVVGEADNATTLLSQLQHTKPDVIVLESQLTSGTDADTCKTLLSILPATRIIFIGSSDGPIGFRKRLEAGAHGFLLTNIHREELVQAIHTVAEGIPYLCSEATIETFRLLRRQPSETTVSSPIQALSPQEQRVIALIAEGYTNKEIASKLTLSFCDAVKRLDRDLMSENMAIGVEVVVPHSKGKP